MNTDVEELVREGMHRLAEVTEVPPGVVGRARRHQRQRRLAVRAAVACGTAGVTAAAAVAVITGAGGGPARPGAGGAQARTVAYVVRRVENALAGEHLVFRGNTTSTGQTSIAWAYGPRNRFEEFTGKACGHTLPNGECTHHGGSVPYLASGTALVGGKLVDAYVTYFNRRYSLSPLRGSMPANACSTTPALAMGGPPIPTNHWSNFIHVTLACGAAKVTGHVRVDGVETTKITGVPVTVRLSKGYARAVRERWARARWILYVNPKTYLPVRMYGSTQTFGGRGGSTLFASVTDVQWLAPTAANIARALVTIPAGFHRMSSPAHQ